MKSRADQLLVALGLFESRARAQAAIAASGLSSQVRSVNEQHKKGPKVPSNQARAPDDSALGPGSFMSSSRLANAFSLSFADRTAASLIWLGFGRSFTRTCEVRRHHGDRRS